MNVGISPVLNDASFSPFDPSVPVQRSTFLMCKPTLYEVSYVINPWMAGNIHTSSRSKAKEQWKDLYSNISQIAEVSLIDPKPGLPDMVFTANAGLERNGVTVLSNFFHKERQGEEQYFRQWFQNRGYDVVTLPREISFEGEGDALFSEDGTTLWAGYGQRTMKSSHRYLSNTWNVEVVSLYLQDSRFYHLDTCFAPLTGGFVMYYPPAFDSPSLRKIEDRFAKEKRILVDEPDAMQFACNVINVGNAVVLNEISKNLSSQLAERAFYVVQVPLGEFIKAGGAAKCLVMKLSKSIPD